MRPGPIEDMRPIIPPVSMGRIEPGQFRNRAISLRRYQCTNVERLFSNASNVLDSRNLNTKSLEKLVFLKENLKLGNFALD